MWPLALTIIIMAVAIVTLAYLTKRRGSTGGFDDRMSERERNHRGLWEAPKWNPPKGPDGP